jgi:hypothetical protein
LPSGATLSHGTDLGGGVWSVDAADLTSIQLYPPADFSGVLSLQLSATTTDGSDSATVTQSFEIAISGVADEATASANDATGTEDSAIPLSLSAALSDASESLTIKINGVPSGAALSHGTNNGDGSWTVAQGDLASLSITPPTNFSGTMNLQIETTSTDGTDSATTIETFTVTVSGDADAAVLSADDVSGNEDTAITLNLSAGLADDSETLDVVISGVPSGASLSHGTDIGDGSWSVTQNDLSSLSFTPPANFSGTINLQIHATTTDSGDSQTTIGGFTVTVSGEADAPVVAASGVTGNEDTTIALDLSAVLSDASESLVIVISGVPAGATLSHGSDNGDGSWTVAQADLDTLGITPPANFSGTMNLQIEASSTDGTDTTSTTAAFTVTVDGIADAPTVTAGDASGNEDGSIALSLAAAAADGSESLDIVISGVPAGASLSHGTELGDGYWSVDAGDLASMSITPPANFSGTINLQIAVTSTDGSDSVTSNDSFTVTVAGVADTPTVTAADVNGSEDNAIALSLAASTSDGSETISVVISGVPSGASLSHGTDNGDGTWSVDASDLAALSITPPVDFSGTINLQIETTSTDGSDTATTTESFAVTVAGVADTPTVSATNVTGSEDNAIALSLTAAASDGSETIAVVISGVPEGASLSHRTRRWILVGRCRRSRLFVDHPTG